MRKQFYAFIIFFILPAVSFATTRYVDSVSCSGNYSIINRNCTGSDGTSYTTIDAAENASSCGDTVYVRSGAYSGLISISRSCTEGNELTISAYTGESPVISGNYFAINGSDWIIINGFEITGGAQGVYSGSGSTTGITVSNCNIHDIDNGSAQGNPTIGINMHYSSGYHTITRNTIYNVDVNGMYEEDCCIRIWGGDENLIENNTLYNCGDGIKLTGNGSNSIIRGNTIHDISSLSGHSDAVQIDCVSNLTIERNLIWNIASQLVMAERLNCPTNANANANLIWRYNVFFQENDSWHNGYGINIYYAPNSEIYNNVFAHYWYRPIALREGTDGTIYNNIFYDAQNSGDQYLWPSSPKDYNYYYGTYTGTTSSNNDDGSHSVSGRNPLFVNPTGPAGSRDYSLQSTSQLIDVGMTITSGLIDLAGVLVPQGSGVDIGAYEYDSGTTPAPPTKVRIIMID